MNQQNTQHTVKYVPVLAPVFLYVVTMLIFQIKRIISSEKWFNYVVPFFFFENAKNLGRSDDGRLSEKKKMASRRKAVDVINGIGKNK